MNKKNIIKSMAVAIILLIVALVFARECKRCPEVGNSNQGNTDTITVTITDTFEVLVPHYIPVPGETIYVNIPQVVDTPAIINDYFTMYYSVDTAINTDSIRVIVMDSIFKNKVISRSVDCLIKFPTEINNYITTYDTCQPCKQFNLGLGAIISGSENSFGIGPSIVLTTNKKSSYSLSYDVVNKMVQIGIYWNIK